MGSNDSRLPSLRNVHETLALCARAVADAWRGPICDAGAPSPCDARAPVRRGTIRGTPNALDRGQTV